MAGYNHAMGTPLYKSRWLQVATGTIFVVLVVMVLFALRHPTSHLIPGATTPNVTVTDNTTGPGKSSTDLPKTNESNPVGNNTVQQTSSENSTAKTTANAPNDESLPPISPKMATEVQRLESHSTEGLVTEQRPNGSAYMNLQGRMQTTTVAVVDKNGKLIIRHGGDFLPDTDTNKTDEEKKQ